MKRLILQRIQEVWASVLTIPNPRVWRRCALTFACFTAGSGATGFASGFLHFEPIRVSPLALLLLALHLLFSPAIIEEIIFRAGLLPRKTVSLSRPRLVTLCALALGLFVASHAINGLFFRRVDVFLNPVFLLLTAMLGATCIATYLASRSIWPGVIIHWTAVFTWITVLGGHRLLGHV